MALPQGGEEHGVHAEIPGGGGDRRAGPVCGDQGPEWSAGAHTL